MMFVTLFKKIVPVAHGSKKDLVIPVREQFSFNGLTGTETRSWWESEWEIRK